MYMYVYIYGYIYNFCSCKMDFIYLYNIIIEMIVFGIEKDGNQIREIIMQRGIFGVDRLMGLIIVGYG